MQFFLFRVSLNDSSQYTMFPPERGTQKKAEILKTAMLRRPQALYRTILYSFNNMEEMEGSLLGRVSHPNVIDRTIPSEVPGQLVDVVEDSNAWAHFLFLDEGEQILAVQKKVEFFSGEADGLAAIIEKLITAGLNDPSYEARVYPVTRPNGFWENLARMSHLYRVDFEFVAPNMFGGRKELADLLELERAFHNANIFRAGVESPTGNLRYPRESQTEIEVEYAEAGGGTWSMEGATSTGTKVHVRSDRDDAQVLALDEDEKTKSTIAHRVSEIVAKILRLLN